jgi:hypothetical protein
MRNQNKIDVHLEREQYFQALRLQKLKKKEQEKDEK